MAIVERQKAQTKQLTQFVGSVFFYGILIAGVLTKNTIPLLNIATTGIAWFTMATNVIIILVFLILAFCIPAIRRKSGDDAVFKLLIDNRPKIGKILLTLPVPYLLYATNHHFAAFFVLGVGLTILVTMYIGSLIASHYRPSPIL